MSGGPGTGFHTDYGRRGYTRNNNGIILLDDKTVKLDEDPAPFNPFDILYESIVLNLPNNSTANRYSIPVAQVQEMNPKMLSAIRDKFHSTLTATAWIYAFDTK